MVWIWQHDKRTDDYKIILNCVRKFMKNKSEKESEKGPSFKKVDGTFFWHSKHYFCNSHQHNYFLQTGQAVQATVQSFFLRCL